MPVDERILLMGEHLKKWVRLRPNYEFLIDWVSGKGERRLTYKQVTEDVYRLCWALKDLGMRKGDMAATLGYNSIELLETVLGSSFIGYVFGCQNPDLPDDWLVTIINDRMAAKVLFFDDECQDKVKRLMPKFKSVQHYICLDGPAEDEEILNYGELISKYEPHEVEVEVKPNDLNGLMMSGGTTGVPKAAMWSHEANYWGASYIALLCEAGAEDTGIWPTPLFWSTIPHDSLFSTLLAGTKSVFLKGKITEPGAIELCLEAVAKEGGKWGAFFAAWFLEIAAWPEEKAKQYDLSSYVPLIWGMNVPLPVWKRVHERFGMGTIKLYSCCEETGSLGLNSTSASTLLKQGKEAITSLGCPFGLNPTMVRLVDSEGNDVKPGEVGEMILKGPGMAHGYLAEPERWARKYKEGWLYTGDMCRVDEFGYIYMVAKKEDIGSFPVDKGGKYVLPYPIQDAVTAMEKVVESSLISVPDPDYKAKYRIIVRPKKGVELSADEVLKVATKVAPDYLIKDVIIRKEPITKTATGKILVRALAEEYGGIVPEE
jgi:acyl-coenzyme A synthetase/AMP-(fatty) acid ligase